MSVNDERAAGPAEPRNAATVVLIRDGQQGLETLLLKRNKALLFAGGIWVFPGGALDPADLDAAGGDIDDAARRAAVREAREEAGIAPDPDALVQISHWTTPVVEPKRFYTWFFVAPAPVDATVAIDGGEIHDSQWIAVEAAVARHRAGELGLYPPTYMTLLRLRRYDTVERALAGIAALTPPKVLPVFGSEDGKMQVMYEGDAGYENCDAASPGARHRVTMEDSVWNYRYEMIGNEVRRLD